MSKRRHPELEGYESNTLYTFELKKQGQSRRDRITWSLLGMACGLGLAVAGYVGSQSLRELRWPFGTPQPTADTPFSQGARQAMNAAELTQTAQSSEDWVQVAMLWQQAMTQMQAVPKNAPNYALAQEKVAEYERNLQYAQNNVANQPPQTPNQQLHWTIGSDRDRVLSVQGIPSQVIQFEHSCQETLRYDSSVVELKNGYVTKYDNFDNNLKVLASDRPVLSIQGKPNTWSLGSSKEEIYQVQGTPSQTSEYTSGELVTLYYGDSSITLENNQVVSYFNVDRNLKVSLLPILPPSRPVADSWSLGSSRAEVLMAQRTTPTYVSRSDSLCEEVFHFEDSEVFFSRGMVTGYQNGSQNLRVR